MIITQTITNDEHSNETKKSELESVVKTLQAKKQEIETTKGELSNRVLELTEIEEKLNSIRAQYETLLEVSEVIENKNMELAEAKQSLTKEMERLLGANFRRRTDLVGGITVDSEYIIFVIDTSLIQKV